MECERLQVCSLEGKEDIQAVDYFDFEGDDGGRFPLLLQQIKDNIIDNLNNATNEGVREKIKWIIEKYNEECARTKRMDFMIDIALKGV